MFEKLLNRCGYVKRKSVQYQKIEYKDPPRREENNDALLEALAFGHHWIQDRKEEDYKSIGMIFTVILLIEHKLCDLLKQFDPSIDQRTLGGKIETYKAFLKAYTPSDGEDVREYRNLIAPLKKILAIRNALAHDISKSIPDIEMIEEIGQYVKAQRPDIYRNVASCADVWVKSIGIISCFGFVFSSVICHLRIQVE